MRAIVFTRIKDPEQEVVQIPDVVLDHHLNVDDVQVAADHLRFHGYGRNGAALTAAETQFHPAGLHRLHNVSVAHWRRPPPVQSGLGDRAALRGAEQPQGGLLARAYGVDSGGGPDNYNQSYDKSGCQADSASAETVGNTPDGAAQSGQDLVEIHLGRSWWLPSGLIHSPQFLAAPILSARSPH